MDSSREIFHQRQCFSLAYPGKILSNLLDVWWFCLLDTFIVGIFPLPFAPGLSSLLGQKSMVTSSRYSLFGSHSDACSAAAR